MALASLDDINVHLPEDKLQVDSAQYVPLQLDAERIVRGTLAGYLTPATLAGWDTPDHTPETIRAIAGRLIAAFEYKRRYSEDSLEVPKYAQAKYDEAINWLNQIKTGLMELAEVTDAPSTGERLTSLNFLSTNPVFTMDQVFP